MAKLPAEKILTLKITDTLKSISVSLFYRSLPRYLHVYFAVPYFFLLTMYLRNFMRTVF